MNLEDGVLLPGIILMIIAVVSSASLAYVNTLTEPIIEERKEETLQSSLKLIFPDADMFEPADSNYLAKKNGNTIGWVHYIKSSGYSSEIELLVGVDQSKKVTGIQILFQEETPGLGANIEKQEFIEQFVNKNLNEIKLTKDGGSIDAVTGATVSSRAVTSGINTIPVDSSSGAS